jgi:hypothetical protein
MESKQVTIYNITPDELTIQISDAVDAKYKLLQLNNKKDKEELLSVEETLKFLKCSKQALWNWRKNGVLPCHRLGNRVYYKKSDIFAKLIKQE